MGRFLQQDSELGTPFQPNTLHRYAYALNNPVNVVDPSGHMPALGRSVNPVPGLGAAASYLGDAARSVNRAAWSTFSDTMARAKSQGLRPALCGLAQTLVDEFNSIYADVTALVVPATRDTVLDFLNSDVGRKLTHNLHELQQFAEEHRGMAALAIIGGVLVVTAAATLFTGGAAFPVLAGAVAGIVSGVAGQFLLDQLTGQRSDWEAYAVQAAIGALSGAVGGAAGLGARAVGSSGAFAGLATGASVGAVSQTTENLLMGRPLREGVAQMALYGAMGGLVAGAVLGQLPVTASLSTRLIAGGLTGGGVSAGGQLAFNLASGEDPLEGVGQAFAVGFATGVVDATIDYGADRWLMGDTLSTGCANSFVAGTLVATASGLVAIEEVMVGDRVLAEDPETGEQGYFEVVAVTNHPTDEVLAITVASITEDGGDEGESDQSTTHDVMQVTPEHPIYVEGEGWLLAENLELGDRLRRADGGMAKVLAIDRLELDEPQPVYNFTVKGPHTYFVLDAGVLVHNSCNLQERVDKLHSLLDRIAQGMRTTAALKVRNASTGEIEIWFASSAVLSRTQLDALDASSDYFIDNVKVEGSYIYHAEQNLVIAQTLNPEYEPLELAASRPICSEICEGLVRELMARYPGVKVWTPFKSDLK